MYVHFDRVLYGYCWSIHPTACILRNLNTISVRQHIYVQSLVPLLVENYEIVEENMKIVLLRGQIFTMIISQKKIFTMRKIWNLYLLRGQIFPIIISAFILHSHKFRVGVFISCRDECPFLLAGKCFPHKSCYEIYQVSLCIHFTLLHLILYNWSNSNANEPLPILPPPELIQVLGPKSSFQPSHPSP